MGHSHVWECPRLHSRRTARSAIPRERPFPWSPVRAATGSTPLSTVIGMAGSVVVLGGRKGGLGGNLEPGRGFPGPGGFQVSPQCVSGLVPLLSVYSCSRAVVFLTSPSLLCERVRSGTRRRRAASASAQAAGRTGTGTRRPHTRALRCRADSRNVSLAVRVLAESAALNLTCLVK